MEENEKINWPLTNDELSELFGIKTNTLRSHIRNHKKELTRGIHYTKENFGVANAPGLMYAWNKKGAIKIAHYCKRSAKATQFLKENNINPLHTNYIEGDLLEIIIRCFNGIYNCKKQHNINRLRVDLFIEELGLIVECDEMDHTNRDCFEEKYREEVLSNNFGFTILRFNPDSKSFNIGNVINEILIFAINK